MAWPTGCWGGDESSPTVTTRFVVGAASRREIFALRTYTSYRWTCRDQKRSALCASYFLLRPRALLNSRRLVQQAKKATLPARRPRFARPIHKQEEHFRKAPPCAVRKRRASCAPPVGYSPLLLAGPQRGLKARPVQRPCRRSPRVEAAQKRAPTPKPTVQGSRVSSVPVDWPATLMPASPFR